MAIEATGRGHARTIRTTSAIALAVEGQSLAMDVLDHLEGIEAAIAADQQTLAVHLAGRLAQRASATQNELRRLVGGIDQ